MDNLEKRLYILQKEREDMLKKIKMLNDKVKQLDQSIHAINGILYLQEVKDAG